MLSWLFFTLFYSSADTAGYHRVALVVAHCRESLGWLSDVVEAVLPPSNSPDRLAGVSVHLFEKCGSTLGLPRVGNRSDVAVFHVPSRNQGFEAQSFLVYLTTRLQDYPAEWTIFLQGRSIEHKRNLLAELRRRTDPLNVSSATKCRGYCPLSDRHLLIAAGPCRPQRTRCASALCNYVLHGDSNATRCPARVATMCCAQFMVHRSAVLRANQAMWHRALEIFDWEPTPTLGKPSRENLWGFACPKTRTCKSQAATIEGWWHMLFGAPPVLRLPMSGSAEHVNSLPKASFVALAGNKHQTRAAFYV
eukprot:TRINITY_DN5071_c0_g1_i1.p1 TRINITY_DN5071_c0_g1~~TRINITY_DN5071_c0_g1_i1.p1  ORF type:complete len:316 (+),score=19.49 TRINITY_DN5071_c0_g1_i1:33-950(+)